MKLKSFLSIMDAPFSNILLVMNWHIKWRVKQQEIAILVSYMFPILNSYAIY